MAKVKLSGHQIIGCNYIQEYPWVDLGLLCTQAKLEPTTSSSEVADPLPISRHLKTPLVESVETDFQWNSTDSTRSPPNLAEISLCNISIGSSRDLPNLVRSPPDLREIFTNLGKISSNLRRMEINIAHGDVGQGRRRLTLKSMVNMGFLGLRQPYPSFDLPSSCGASGDW